jgi:hypothetical protein
MPPPPGLEVPGASQVQPFDLIPVLIAGHQIRVGVGVRVDVTVGDAWMFGLPVGANSDVLSLANVPGAPPASGAR